ncbi:FRG domain-containing protein [Thalassobellus suaedae]|uniref:FRG domain-containing protein n=1 Tax=Thalassobellus suaedae TaxID=3074124 RepID=A0ABY9Y5I0_9FLAO|nr:FRG domain-containing protein [Flavobacteriaceae bacterium HL-DH10]
MSENHSDNIFCEYTIKSWTDLRTLFSKIDDWVFRGHADSQWTLQTTLERGAEMNKSGIRDIPAIEKNIIDKFKRRASNYLDEFPDDDNLLEWLSLIQHHGGPTRLLDFSKSYYVGLFFSVNHTTTESAVYCLNRKLIYNKGLETEEKRYREDFLEFGSRAHCNFALKEQTLSPLVTTVEPYNIHERLSRQQGLFAIPFEGRQSFEYNLSLTVNSYQKELPKSKKIENFETKVKLLNEECGLLKIIIPTEFHNEIKKDLKLMNITNETLFPGIDGFSKSLFNEFDIS